MESVVAYSQLMLKNSPTNVLYVTVTLCTNKGIQLSDLNYYRGAKVS